jgi:chitin synthase
MLLGATDYIKFVITAISFIDFIVFIVFFMSFIIKIPYKSKNINTKIISIFIIIFFLGFKCLHLPIFLSTISVINYSIPGSDIIIGLLTWINILLAAVPLVLAITTVFVYKKPSYTILKECMSKRVNIIMPIYNENPDSLWRAIESILKLDYPKQLLHVYLSFDEGVSANNSEGFVKLLERYDLDTADNRERIDIDIEGVLISICRFEHGGKKSAQFGGFKMMESDDKEITNSLVFFIDSDIILKPDSLCNFTYYLDKYNKSALTGIITCIASGKPNFLTYYQDIEYVSGQIFWRNLEVYFGSTTCLPGAFTILKYSFLKKVSDEYFNSTTYDDDVDYQRFYLGEDRYLTHLLMEIEPWKLGFCESARCKTDAPNTISSLLKQRRRWYLGHISNDIWMISSSKLWKSYPLLCLFNLFNNTRNTSIYIYLLYFVVMFNKNISIFMWLMFIILPIVLNWIFLIFYSMSIRRKMNIIFYIVILLIQPIISMMYMYYTIWTMRERSWGGARVESISDIENQI